jgi:hypothetical protein
MAQRSQSPAANGARQAATSERPANTVSSPSTQAPARLVVRLELDASKSGLSYRRLRWLLKALIRQHRLRCISVGPDRGPHA